MITENRGVKVYPGPGELGTAAAERFTRLAREAVRERGLFAALLSGGRTPRTLYSLLGSDMFAEAIEWQAVHLFWGDERCVGPGSPRSNYAMVREALLSRIEIPDRNVHRILGELDPAQAAREYEDEIRKILAGAGRTPVFDLVLLGLGTDGHTLSLFPGSAALEETRRMVVADTAPDGEQRVTVTLPVVNNARNVVFMVSGAEKAGILKDLVSGVEDGRAGALPASLVRPAETDVVWLVDEAAAGLL